MVTRRRAVAVLLSLAASVLVRPAPAREPGARAAIAELLQARARALLERDRDAFMATVGGPPAFRARQGALFDNLSGVRLASYELRAAWERYGDLARAPDLKRYPGAEAVALPVTEERYRIAGFDRRPSVEDLYYTFVRRDGRWRIESDSDLDDLALMTSRHLWDFGPVEAARSEHFLLLFHPCASGGECDPQRLLGAAEEALARVDTYWSVAWLRRVVVLVPSTAQELARILQATFDVRDFVAFAFATVDPERDLALGGARVILNPEAFAGRSHGSTLGILAHELLHVATRASAGPFTPNFLEEGIAEFVGRGHGPGALAFFEADVASGVFDGRLPRDHEFLIGGGTQIYRQYQESLSAITYLVERFGRERLEELYLWLGRHRVALGTQRYWVDRAFRRTLGLSLRSFERAWARAAAG